MSKPPPKPKSKPSMVTVVRAMFLFEARNSDELSFKEGDTIYILDKESNKDWWTGRCGNKTGLVPSNYVQEGFMETIDNPMHDAAKRGNVEFLQECLINQIPINGIDNAGCTALHWAARGDHMDCLEILLNNSLCDVNITNKMGDTALHLASFKGSENVVKLLVKKNANLNIRNNDKKTAFDLAKSPQIACLLKPVRNSLNDADYIDEADSD